MSRSKTTVLTSPVTGLGVDWVCPSCGGHTANVIEDGGLVSAPMCSHCEKRKRSRYCRGGTIVGLPTAAPAPPPVKEEGGGAGGGGNPQIEGDAWTHLCAVLDAIAVRMAGGGARTDRVCGVCQENPHAGPRACRCPCHAAIAYRRGLEGRGVGRAA